MLLLQNKDIDHLLVKSVFEMSDDLGSELCYVTYALGKLHLIT